LETSTSSLQEFASWVAIVGTSLLAAYFFAFLVFQSLNRGRQTVSWFTAIMERHFAATIAVPLSAVTAACVVILFGATSGGNLTFSLLGFKFEGASGPITLWLVCFLAMIFAVRLLWNSGKSESKETK